jgi:hypothetical protein
MVDAPGARCWGDFKSYPPTAKVETSGPLGLQGTKTFEQIISPENADIRNCPPFAFSFFDPETKNFSHADASADQTDRASRWRNVVAPSVAVKAEGQRNETPQQRWTSSRSSSGSARFPGRRRTARSNRFSSRCNPCPCWHFWRRSSGGSGPTRWRTIRVCAGSGRWNKPSRRTGKLRAHAAQNQSDEFFAELMRLLQERFGERLDCPASAITEAVIDDRLRPRGLPDSTLEELHELFQTCNLARYAPVRSAQELGAVIPKLENALRKLQRCGGKSAERFLSGRGSVFFIRNSAAQRSHNNLTANNWRTPPQGRGLG